jgi:hypothetical protein
VLRLDCPTRGPIFFGLPAPSKLPRTSAAAEDYLERISGLIRRKGYARVVDIAAELGISQASVTAMVQRLDAEGLVKYEQYRGMVLTGAGEEVALRIAHGTNCSPPSSASSVCPTT